MGAVLAQWRSLLTLLWQADRPLTAIVGFLTLVLGLMPIAVALASGLFVGSLADAVGRGSNPSDGRRTVFALAILVFASALNSVGGRIAAYLRTVLDGRFVLGLHEEVARVLLSTRTVAPLETAATTDALAVIEDADRRGTLRATVNTLHTVIVSRLIGGAAALVLFGVRWWAPIPLAAAWYLTQVLYSRTSAKGLTVVMSDGATLMRRSEYVRTLAVDPPAAKEVRTFGLARWVVDTYTDAWRRALEVIWRNRRANRWLTAGAFGRS